MWLILVRSLWGLFICRWQCSLVTYTARLRSCLWRSLTWNTYTNMWNVQMAWWIERMAHHMHCQRLAEPKSPCRVFIWSSSNWSSLMGVASNIGDNSPVFASTVCILSAQFELVSIKSTDCGFWRQSTDLECLRKLRFQLMNEHICKIRFLCVFYDLHVYFLRVFGYIVDLKRALYYYNWVVRQAGVENEVEVTVAQVRQHTRF